MACWQQINLLNEQIHVKCGTFSTGVHFWQINGRCYEEELTFFIAESCKNAPYYLRPSNLAVKSASSASFCSSLNPRPANWRENSISPPAVLGGTTPWIHEAFWRSLAQEHGLESIGSKCRNVGYMICITHIICIEMVIARHKICYYFLIISISYKNSGCNLATQVTAAKWGFNLLTLLTHQNGILVLNLHFCKYLAIITI